MAGRNISVLFLIAVFLLLIVNDTANYYATKRELLGSLEAQMREISGEIRTSIVRSQQAYRYVDRLMAANLRTAAIAAKYALPSDYEEVDNDRLKELSDELGISYLTLFAQFPDDIVSVRASDPRELGLSSKSWDNYYDAFQQLFAKRNVTEFDYGQSLENYWAGEISPSTSILSDVKNKYGYYYDGTTNYLINPIMNTKYIEELEQYTGVETILKDMTDQHEHVLEITLFNPLTIKVPDEELVNVRGELKLPKYAERKILFGQYDWASPEDPDRIERAHLNNRVVHATDKIGDKTVFRTYFPVIDESFATPYVIGITTDYSVIQQKLDKQLFNLSLVTGIALLVSIIMVWIVYRYINKERDDVADAVQNDYNEEVQSLFVAVRGERHDFVNHLQTLKAMADAGRFEQLHRYVKELVDDTMAVNDIVTIGNPAVAAIIQSKSALALRNRIHFEYFFEGMNELSGIKGVKSVDIVRILANLIDNAFEEVAALEPDDRRVRVEGWLERDELVFSVSNSLRRTLSEDQLDKMFQPTYTTKREDGHSGLGLSIVREKVRQYRGRIDVSTPEPTIIQFQVSVPIGA